MNEYTFVTWKWKSPDGFRARYTFDHVNAMASMIGQYCPEKHRTICVTDDPSGVRVPTYPIWSDHSEMRNASGHHLPSCYRRLKLFDRATLEGLGIPMGSRVVSIDLDAVILDDIGPTIRRREPFVGWGVPGSKHPQVLNGSIWMFTAGEYQWMWDTFDPLSSPQKAIEQGFFGSDQSWMSQQLIYSRDTGVWEAQKDGVLSYPRDVRGPRVLPKHARIVMFHGKRKPWDPVTRRESRWLERYYRT